MYDFFLNNWQTVLTVIGLFLYGVVISFFVVIAREARSHAGSFQKAYLALLEDAKTNTLPVIIGYTLKYVVFGWLTVLSLVVAFIAKPIINTLRQIKNTIMRKS